MSDTRRTGRGAVRGAGPRFQLSELRRYRRAASPAAFAPIVAARVEAARAEAEKLRDALASSEHMRDAQRSDRTCSRR